ncbi:MAG: DNA (cytosine-5-)-methyltransferase [Burkholderiaceae bacterium]|nr:DNA (cytosine-5-)-methyltransferase [Polaromonas sp.]MDO8778622.1 DNA (cytosine-5-)-methyltransferase [Burkholderiaceae bacterium]
MTFKLIDLFAGPGGLGEGFASLDDGNTFKIAVSAEMESSAHKTLTLRSFFRHAKSDSKALLAYYNFCNSASAPHPEDACKSLWALAADEARQLTLGRAEDNATLDEAIKKKNLVDGSTVLIGGPPCQAYSLVGRSRNMGKEQYVAEEDHRHFLYREYLRILHKTSPAVFVMENVKGILSAKINGGLIFHDILNDLANPGIALKKGTSVLYKIHSLVSDTYFESGMDPQSIDARDFIVRAENYGIPQARHRVILLGIRADLKYEGVPQLEKYPTHRTVKDAIGNMPKLRSKLSRDDVSGAWKLAISNIGSSLLVAAQTQGETVLATGLKEAINKLSSDLDSGCLRYPRKSSPQGVDSYAAWVHDNNVKVWLNHEARSHMSTDLGRYLYASVFAEQYGYSPKGHREFSLKGLAPAHANWKSGKFADRFRVQRYEAPSTTVTSHISKDGHYFIHPDPAQCRSLTVREAARLQTFADNYFFQGNRTQQFHQVGNAVPSLLANQIASLVSAVLKGVRKQG